MTARNVLLPNGLRRGEQTSGAEVAPRLVAHLVAMLRDCSGEEGCKAPGILEPSIEKNELEHLMYKLKG